MKRKPASPTHRDVYRCLEQFVRPDKAEFFPGFFQAYAGGYGEGDCFLGVVVPDQRKVARQFQELSLAHVRKLLHSKWHECRLTGLFILVKQFERSMKSYLKDNDSEDAKALVDFYLANLEGVNNWDLVDSSAHKILGTWLLHHPSERKVLTRLSRSKVLWEQRIAVIATMPLVHAGEFDELLVLAEKYLDHPHDLMHKAVGWLLREAGKQDERVLKAFLKEHVTSMPRTMLRYAIEKLPQQQRQRWLNA